DCAPSSSIARSYSSLCRKSSPSPSSSARSKRSPDATCTSRIFAVWWRPRRWWSRPAICRRQPADVRPRCSAFVVRLWLNARPRASALAAAGKARRTSARPRPAACAPILKFAQLRLASGLEHGGLERLAGTLAGPDHELERRIVALAGIERGREQHFALP